MRVMDRFRMVRKGKKIYSVIKKVGQSDEEMAGMRLVYFVKAIKKNKTDTLMTMTDDELEMLFSHEDAPKMFKAIPGLKQAYENEVKRRKGLNSSDSKKKIGGNN